MAIYVANNGQLQTVKGIYYAMTEDYINATLFHNLVPKTATEIRFLYASNNPDLTGYQKLGYCDNNNYIEVWNNNTKYIIINPRKNYIYAPVNCYNFLYNYAALTVCVFDNFDTRNTTSMNTMFQGCISLTSLDLSNFNTQNVTNMQSMFYECNELTSLDLSGFNTKNVTSMRAMFYACFRLISLDLSNFNTQNVTIVRDMFNGCQKLATIFANTFNTTAFTTSFNMFYYCTSLVGGNGTSYSAAHVNADYARVDSENGLAGYFTAPTN